MRLLQDLAHHLGGHDGIQQSASAARRPSCVCSATLVVDLAFCSAVQGLDGPSSTAAQREKLLSATQKLQEGSRKLQDARATLHEAEVSVGLGLVGQRQKGAVY